MTKYVLTTGILMHVHTYWRTVWNVCNDTKPLAQGIPRTVNRNSVSRIQNSPLLGNFRGHFNHHTNLREVFSGVFVVFSHMLRNWFRKGIHYHRWGIPHIRRYLSIQRVAWKYSDKCAWCKISSLFNGKAINNCKWDVQTVKREKKPPRCNN
jgi:hypothetical protein